MVVVGLLLDLLHLVALFLEQFFQRLLCDATDSLVNNFGCLSVPRFKRTFRIAFACVPNLHDPANKENATVKKRDW